MDNSNSWGTRDLFELAVVRIIYKVKILILSSKSRSIRIHFRIRCAKTPPIHYRYVYSVSTATQEQFY